jgi:hypothetical protein
MSGQRSSDNRGSSDDIYFLCGQCEQSLVIAASAVGMTIDCPHCGTAIEVPAANADVVAPSRDLFDLPLSGESIAVLERCLVAVVGPIGSPLAKSAISQASTSEELRETLLACIPSTSAQESFLEACRRATAPAERQETTSNSVPQPAKPASGWDEAAVEMVRQNLAIYIGPIAAIMVQRALAKAKTGAELCDRLAAAIPDEKDREKFLQSTPAKLR